jgi:hypothetical protein
MDFESDEVRPILPPDASFLDNLERDNVVGHLNPDEARDFDEKEMLLEALRFYFGPAQWWNAVANDVKNKKALDKLNDDLRKRGGRYKILEEQTGLENYFGKKHPPTDQVKLYAATDKRDAENNPYRLPSYFLYEASENLTFYVGPDLGHGEPWKNVINTQVLSDEHKSVSSHTLDFGFPP